MSRKAFLAVVLIFFWATLFVPAFIAFRRASNAYSLFKL
jgi:hypothetical protein